MDETSDLIQQRIRKLEALKEEGINPFPNHHKVEDTSKDILDTYGSMPDETLNKVEKTFSVAGRIVAVRDFGKASFVQIQDRKGRIQAYIRKDLVGEPAFQLFKKADIGDFIRIEGKIFRTKTHELTIQVQALQLIVKSLRPLPEKWHGLTDVETRYRQRYLDLIANPRAKEIFLIRIQAVQMIRDFFISRDFLEVETPMMHPIPGGATAKPFKTHHNAL
ncbi:MAG TPA: amino acid--tRNA ligase-related protein, partial [Thermodesulfobacteriota bacterium]|nr:amino acid--tRNA ligase-related protein [Thermodesulfobacteriota bacterium]